MKTIFLFLVIVLPMTSMAKTRDCGFVENTMMILAEDRLDSLKAKLENMNKLYKPGSKEACNYLGLLETPVQNTCERLNNGPCMNGEHEYGSESRKAQCRELKRKVEFQQRACSK